MSNSGRSNLMTNPPPGLSKQSPQNSKSNNNSNTNNNNSNNNDNKSPNEVVLKKSNVSNNNKSFLRPNAPEFDVRNSPTIDPYGHPLGVQTRPEYVPPCSTPPILQPQQQQHQYHQMNNRYYRSHQQQQYMMDPNLSREMPVNMHHSHMSNRSGTYNNLNNSNNNSFKNNQQSSQIKNQSNHSNNDILNHSNNNKSNTTNNNPNNKNNNTSTITNNNNNNNKNNQILNHTNGPPIVNPSNKTQPLSFHSGYKTPGRNFGKPKDNEIDPTFQNPQNLLHYQKWELLESAKRWLPGEGTVTTRNGYRYFLGAPIHMGMNGHIHYCYRYRIPSDNNKNQPESVESVAAKVVPNTSAFAREIVILRALQGCENITKLYDVLESKRTLISILELAQADVYSFFVGRGALRHGWSLEKPAVREAFARMVVTNAVQGLKQMHDNDYLHCDLKSLNILLYIYKTDRATKRGGVYMKAKLTDFGHSSHGKIRRSEATFRNGMARVGTAGHVAPELFKEGTACDYKIDIWSLGIVMFSMLVPNKLLFGEYTNLDALKKNYDRLYKMNPYSKDRPKWWTDFERLSPEARDLILWMTQFKPKDRPNGEQILAHPWFLISKGNLKPGEYRPSLRYVHMLSVSSIAQE